MRKSVKCGLFAGLMLAAVCCLASNDAPYVGETFWGTPCQGTIKNQDVFDYTLRSSYPSQLKLTESYHFSPNVENLISGDTSSNPLGDIDFTLTRWPNHHRALNSVIRARLRNMEGYRSTGRTPAECYLQRAINFSPKDATSYMLYGNLLYRVNKLDEALVNYKSAAAVQPNNVEVKYNMGLLYVEMGEYEQAKRYALEVYGKGFPLPGLKRKLVQKGYWNDDVVNDDASLSE